MSMFGFGGRPKPPYGVDQNVYTTPGIGDGAPGMPGDPDRFNLQLPADPYVDQRPEKPSFFQKGGMGGKMLTGALGGALDGIAHYGGMEGGYLPGIQQAEKAQQEWQQRIALEQYKRQNPAPVEEPSVIRTMRAMNIDPTSPEGQQLGRDALVRPAWLGNPETGFTPAGGSYGTPQPSGPPAGAITLLQANPDLAQAFDTKYGAGASRQYLGQ